MSSVMVPSKCPVSLLRVSYFGCLTLGDPTGEGDGAGGGKTSSPGGGCTSSDSGVASESGSTIVVPWGDVPFLNSSIRLSGSSAEAGAPVFGLISTCSIPAGICQSPCHSGCSPNATPMKSVHIGSAEFAPVSPSCDPSSNPTHTTQTRFGVQPANQPSREVPVLPATLPLKPRALTGAAVPRLTTSFKNEVIT